MKIAAEMHFKRPLLRKRTILAQSGPPERFFQGDVWSPKALIVFLPGLGKII